MPYAHGNGIDDLIARSHQIVQERTEQSERLNRGLESLTVVAANHDGSIKVKIDSTGGLADLKIADEAMHRSGRELRDDIMRGIDQARRLLSVRVAEIASDVYGSESATTAFLAGGYADRFGVIDENDEDRR